MLVNIAPLAVTRTSSLLTVNSLCVVCLVVTCIKSSSTRRESNIGTGAATPGGSVLDNGRLN